MHSFCVWPAAVCGHSLLQWEPFIEGDHKQNVTAEFWMSQLIIENKKKKKCENFLEILQVINLNQK